MPQESIAERLVSAYGWKEWGKKFGWTLYGCSGQDSAGFHRNNDRMPINITRAMREDIDEALEQARHGS